MTVLSKTLTVLSETLVMMCYCNTGNDTSITNTGNDSNIRSTANDTAIINTANDCIIRTGFKLFENREREQKRWINPHTCSLLMYLLIEQKWRQVRNFALKMCEQNIVSNFKKYLLLLVAGAFSQQGDTKYVKKTIMIWTKNSVHLL